jgi:hypothetical protein
MISIYTQFYLIYQHVYMLFSSIIFSLCVHYFSVSRSILLYFYLWLIAVYPTEQHQFILISYVSLRHFAPHSADCYLLQCIFILCAYVRTYLSNTTMVITLAYCMWLIVLQLITWLILYMSMVIISCVPFSTLSLRYITLYLYTASYATFLQPGCTSLQHTTLLFYNSVRLV